MLDSNRYRFVPTLLVMALSTNTFCNKVKFSGMPPKAAPKTVAPKSSTVPEAKHPGMKEGSLAGHG
jgi:hypothetical protein